MRWIKNKLKGEKTVTKAPEHPTVSRGNKRYDTRLTDSVLGSVVDLSPDGARIVTRTEPTVRAGHVFEIAIACDGERVFMLSRVAWTRKIDKDLWNIGLHFFDSDARARMDLEKLLDRCAAGRELLSTSVEVEDLYAVLGVPRESSLDQIRTAYRNLARKFHPDHAPDEESSRRFARISKSYMVLRDESLRRRYDQLLKAA